jgi:citrate lyase subunit beta / citryl-CoA lyase
MERPKSRRRACLVVPGGSEKMLAKAATLAADEIVLDLEDAVAPDAKDRARALVLAALGQPGLAGRQVAVRVNAIGTPWCHRDIIAMAEAGHERLSLVVPKLESAGDLAFLDRLLAGIDRKGQVRLQGLIETARGLAGLDALAGASSRLDSLILGYGDLASSLGRSAGGPWGTIQDQMLIVARAHGLQMIDGPHFALGPEGEPGLIASASAAAALGFDGKWAIHPVQVQPITAAFTPSPEAVTRARALIATLDAALALGEGVATLDGQMIDEAMRGGAMRVLSFVETDDAG